jgi:histone-lysine N-methyltransferase NSD1
MMANVTTERAMKMASTASAAEVEQQFIEENGPATPPETLEDPLNNNNNNNNNNNEEKGKKSLTSKLLPKLRLGCGHDCVNRETRYTCDTRVCPCGDDCSNRPFQHLPQPKVKVQLTENRGYGLFLQQDVFEGDFIVEYMGEIVDEEECTRRLLACKGKNEPNFYLMEITPSQIIDARFCGNNARFINSSCHPNCETQRWVDASTNETRVGIFATEDIKSGTELTYDYNFAHFGGEGTTSFTCFCGHPMCKGTLDANPERMRRFMDRVTVTMKNGDVKTGTVLEYTVNKKYKLLLDDEQDVKVWSKSKKSEEEKAESALKKTKNRKYITVNLDNSDFASKKGGKKDAKLACVWLTNRTNFTESKVKKKKVDEKKKSATTTKKKAGKRKRPRAATKKLKEQEQEQELDKKTPTTPLKEIVLSPVKRLVENAIANVVKYIY